ncbi:MAG: hypothetical protein ACOVLC_12615 [Flavobacterium sp.]
MNAEFTGFFLFVIFSLEPIARALHQWQFPLFVSSWLAFGFFCSQPQELISIALGLPQKNSQKQHQAFHFNREQPTTY